jgi:aminopeptidase-like protein
MGGDREAAFDQMALLWVLNLSDGGHTLLDIADRAGYEFTVIKHAAEALRTHELLGPPCDQGTDGGQ